MSIPNFSLEGKVAIITGGRRGIGRALALGFAEAGADVAVCDMVVDDGKLQAVADEVRKVGRRSLAVQTDIRRKSDVDNLVQRVVDEFGAIDILVNNAVIIDRGPMLELSEEGWNNVIETNLKGYFLCSQAVARRMVEKKRGTIINITSTESLRAVGGSVAYTVSKAGQDMLTKVLALELARHNIRVNAVAVHMVRTEMSDIWYRDPEKLKPFNALVPMGTSGETSDIVGATLFLASDAASLITGHAIPVDGGYLAGDAMHPKSRSLGVPPKS